MAGVCSDSGTGTERSSPEPPARPIHRRCGGHGRGRGRGRASKPVQQKSDLLESTACVVETGSSTDTSESTETRRIHAAASKWKPGGHKKTGQTKMTNASEDSDNDLPAGQHPAPTGTPGFGLLDFTEWMFQHVVQPADHQKLSDWHGSESRTFGEFCAGMATASIAAAALERSIAHTTGKQLHLQTALVTECVPWKRQIAEQVAAACHPSSPPPETWARTADLVKESAPATCDIAVLAIECDDVSVCTSTPRSVLDETGRSGKSFLEFLAYLAKLSFTSRPTFLLVECVANLARLRTAASERGTQKVSEKLEEQGYIGKWEILNTRYFGVPQSRPRAYGVFVKLATFGSSGKSKHQQQLQAIWAFVARCQTKVPESLMSLLQKCNLATGTCQHASKKQRSDKAGQSDGKASKWVQEHERHKQRHGVADMDPHPVVTHFKAQAKDLPLTPREVDAAMLVLSVALRNKKVQPECIVGDIGSSVNRILFRSSLHPCVLPQKKYLYIVNDEVYCGCPANLAFSLQGLGAEEIRMCKLDTLDAKRAQELSGNAFTSNVIASLMLSVLLHYRLP